jgi:putative ABC transport system substrate-binding protein
LLRGGFLLAGFGLTVGCSAIVPRTGQPPRVVRIGLLSTSALDPSPEGAAFRAGLRQHGWIDGSSAIIDARFAYAVEGLRARARELVASGVDVLVTIGNDATKAAREASQSVPIVMILSTHPLRDGFVASMGRPDGNVTGLTNLGSGLNAKRLERFKEAVPSLSKVAIIWFVDSGDVGSDLEELKAAAQALHVELVSHPLQTHNFLESAFGSIAQSGEDGVLVLSEHGLFSRRPVVTLAIKHRLPAMSETRTFVSEGGLLAYGPNPPDLYRRGAYYVDRILRGAKPSDLPVEQPATFDFVVNLKTAQALGLTIPQATLLQATEVIQ